MSNEKKAKELADCCPNCTFSCGDRLNCKTESTYNILMKMAEWKDEQHKQELIRIYNFVNPYLTPEANKDLKILIGLH